MIEPVIASLAMPIGSPSSGSLRAQVPIGDPDDDEGGLGDDHDEDDEDDGDDGEYDDDEE